MIKLSSLMRIAGLLIALVISPAIVMAEVTKDSGPLDLTVNCGGEDIHILGTFNAQYTLVEEVDTYTFMFKVWFRGEGYGMESGDSYILREKWMDFTHEVVPPIVYVLNDHGRLLGQGDAPDYFYRYQIKFVVNANGEVVLDTSNYLSDCGP